MTTYDSTTTRLHQDLNACSMIEDLLPLYIEGEVSPKTRDLMVAHLAHCDHCAGFLAGAQSARRPRRGDAAARSGVMARDQAAQFAVTNGQRFLTTLAGLIASGAVVVFSGATWAAGDPAPPALGPLLALLLFAAVAAKTQHRGRVTLPQWLMLAAACVAGGIGATSVVGPVRHYELHFFGMLLVLAGIAGVRYIWGQQGNGSRALSDG